MVAEILKRSVVELHVVLVVLKKLDVPIRRRQFLFRFISHQIYLIFILIVKLKPLFSH